MDSEALMDLQHWRTLRGDVQKELPEPHRSSAPQTSDVMLLLGRCGFRWNGAGCLATGYRKEIIKLH